MKKTKKLLCLLMAVVILAMTLVACSSDEESEATSEEVSTVSTENGERYDENGYLMDDLGTMDFHEKEIRVLAWQEKKNELGHHPILQVRCHI